MTFIEGGWPGANPKDEEFFARAPAELRLSTSTLVAFGSTRRAGVQAEDDETLRHLVKAQTAAVCIVAKSSEMHVVDALRTTLDEAVAMVADSVDFLRDNDLRVFLDAEHFFDGYKANPEFTLRILRAAEEAGAETLVLVRHQRRHPAPRGRAHRRRPCSAGSRPRSGCTSTTTAAARWPTRWPRCGAGATHVQGCVNGYGERAGNADLSAAIPDLSLKLQVSTIPTDRLELLTPVSHHIAELVNIAPNPQQPFVGRVGLRPQGRTAHLRHRPALRRLRAHRPRAGRQRDPLRGLGDGRPLHPRPEGRGAGLELDSARHASVLDSLKDSSTQGYHFEVADGSLELLLRNATGWEQDFFELESYRVIADHSERRDARPRRRSRSASATSGSWPPPRATARSTPSTGPCARPSARATRRWPHIHLVDYRVRVLDTAKGTGVDHPGPHRLDRRRPHLDHHRGLGEHHRGVLAGPVRLHRLRSAPRRSRELGRLRATGPSHRPSRPGPNQEHR